MTPPPLPTPKVGRMRYNPANFAYNIGTGPWAPGYAVKLRDQLLRCRDGTGVAALEVVGTQDGPEGPLRRVRADSDPGGPDGAGDGAPDLAPIRRRGRAVDPRDRGQRYPEVARRRALNARATGAERILAMVRFISPPAAEQTLGADSPVSSLYW